MSTGNPQTRRCAIYTRKSSDEGLDQAFNSLDAQREACEAYIKSQVGEGWKLVRTRFDDGGISGGTLDRPALQQLLADIQAGKVDTVVVYKVDRLTRSLAGFAKIMETFDAHEVSFVSVTQQFNTTTSMGRLTLNMLLSFAQFEREVTGERIRDKIAASKRKGMWMGGVVPLGYEPDGRTLTINEDEAETVRSVYRLYLAHENVRRVKAEADRHGLKTKIRNTDDGVTRGGRPLSRGYIYKLLNNPLYIGRIAHKGETHDGLHPPIIDMDTWTAVQEKLAANSHEHRSGGKAKEASLLAGKIFDEAGVPLTPSHAVKSGRRYRYYVSKHLISGSEGSSPKGWRLPAHEIERVVGDAASAFMADRAAIANEARAAGIPVERIGGLLHAAGCHQGDAMALVQRVDLGSGEILLTLNAASLLGEPGADIQHRVPMNIKRRGVEMRLVIENSKSDGPSGKPDMALARAVARAHRWFDDLSAGRIESIGAIAKAEGVTDRYIARLLPLAFLAPEIVEAILAGRQPITLTLQMLTKHVDLPLDWAEQKAVLGFN